MEKFKYIPHTERATFALKESANAVKCSTGSTQNNDRFVPGTNKDAARFMSHYTDNYKRSAPTGSVHPTTIQVWTIFNTNFTYRINSSVRQRIHKEYARL